MDYAIIGGSIFAIVSWGLYALQLMKEWADGPKMRSNRQKRSS